MKRRLSRRKFIASAALSIVPPAIAYAQPKSGGLLALIGDEPRPAKPPKTDWKDAGVIDLNNSHYAKLKTVTVRAVVIQDGFWSRRRQTTEVVNIPSMHEELLVYRRL